MRAVNGQTPPGPPFKAEQENGIWWLAAPDGKRFFSRGVCCVDTGISWLDFKPENPGYAAWQHYRRPAEWADSTLERLKRWGFTTIGAWSDAAALKLSKKMDLPYTVVLHLVASGAPWWDMWDPVVIHDLEQTARSQIERFRNDPLLIGYFTDNELGWWNAALLKAVLEQAPSGQTRRRLLSILRESYKNDWDLLKQDFEPDGAGSFAGLEQGGRLFLRPGGNGRQTLKPFVAMVARRYYQLTREVIRKYDARALILGDRYQSFYYPEVAKEAGQHLDIVSTNLNAAWNDGRFARFYLETLYALARKPILVTEHYLCAMENRSGNQNSSADFPVVGSQKERARSYQNSTRALASSPHVVGLDWFQYYDEPKFGRDDGENYNMGLVDIHDRPYEEITLASASLDLGALHAKSDAGMADASSGVPPAPMEPMRGTTARELMERWDRQRGFVPSASSHPLADLYACWGSEALYLGIYCIDPVEPGYYKDGKIPETDRMEWMMNVDGKGGKKESKIRIGGAAPATVHGEALEIKQASGGVRYAAVVRLPARWFGKEALQAGDVMSVWTVLKTHARAYTMEWKADLILAK
ncbi:MAG: hypothetical protein HY717_24005 [Planctomycetes bacterium]|nr:hypothetical protein [Planctomycetota bacterium]